ncbi:hypothetical protein [Archangium lansingense]|uniref:PhiE125 gp8 family phage protein n=1 Tax=Archangium lansingense TaxID=2995310 RepID=A0ABT4AF37_9BACT|nr:hypothetical protein [Archangium lansinium]MCY1080294.1 hypothetical protein [Archangium lansinium]
MATEYDLTTVARAAGRLKVSSSDAQLPALVTAASRALANWLGYEVHLRTDAQESVPSEGGRRLFLRAGAVRRLVRITVGGEEVAATDYHLESPRHGRIVRRSCAWPFTGTWTAGVSPIPHTAYDTGEIVVTYDAGWRTPGQVELALAADPTSTLTSDLPAELEEAVLATVTALYRPAGRDPNVTSRSVGDASVTWSTDPKAVPEMARQLAEPHRKTRNRRQS